MKTHIRQTFLESIIAILETMGTGDPEDWSYSYPDRVFVSTVNQNALNRDNFPNIIVLIGGERFVSSSTAGTERNYAVTATVVIDCLLKTSYPVEDTNAFLFDIETVLGADWTLGGTCQDSRLVSNEVLLHAENSPYASLQVTLEVDYNYVDGSPDVRRK